MIGDLEKLHSLFYGTQTGEVTDDERQEYARVCEQLTETMRRVVGEYASMFSALVDTLGTLDWSQHKALQARIADIVTHHRDPAPFTGPQLTPYELLHISARLSALGEPLQAGRLRRLADWMVYSIPQQPLWIGIDYAKQESVDKSVYFQQPICDQATASDAGDQGRFVLLSPEQTVNRGQPVFLRSIKFPTRITTIDKRYALRFHSIDQVRQDPQLSDLLDFFDLVPFDKADAAAAEYIANAGVGA